MKKILSALVLAVFLIGCGDSMYRNGKEYECYGLFDKDDVRDQHVKYELVTGNIIWGVIGFETAVLPIWLFGFRLYCPEYVPADQTEIKTGK